MFRAGDGNFSAGDENISAGDENFSAGDELTESTCSNSSHIATSNFQIKLKAR